MPEDKHPAANNLSDQAFAWEAYTGPRDVDWLYRTT